MSNNDIYGGKFCSPDEYQISTIGTGYIANYASGNEAKQSGATLTNKRIYFSGSVYMRNTKGHFSSYQQRKIINIRDITGTSYDFYRPLQYVLWGVLLPILCPGITSILTDGNGDAMFSMFVISIILSIVLVIIYFVKRMTLLTIEYAGGNIAFNVRWIQKHEQDDFIRNIHLVLDKIYGAEAVTHDCVNTSEVFTDLPDL